METPSNTRGIRQTVRSYHLLFWLLTVIFIGMHPVNTEANPSPTIDYIFYDDPALLSIGTIKAIAEDKQGYIWVAGAQGLLRYDGYTFKAYLHNDDDITSISTNSINDILITDDGYLWVATYWELNRFDPTSGKFERFSHDPYEPRSLSHNSVMSLAQGANGIIWVGTAGGGLNRFNPKTQDFDRFTYQADDSNSISDNNIDNLLEDSIGQLWIGFPDKGLDLFDPQEGKVIQRFRHRSQNEIKPEGEGLLTHNRISGICESADGQIWASTIGNGYIRIDPSTKKVNLYPQVKTQGSGVFSSLSTVNIYAIAPDNNGDILFGSAPDAPLSLYRKATNDFARYRLPSLPLAAINSLFRDRSGGLWIGLLPRGLLRINRYSEALEIYQRDPRTNEGLSDSSVSSIAEDSQGNLLVGTRRGLNRINRNTGEIQVYKRQHSDLDFTDETSLSGDTISAILPDDSNQVLLGNTWRGVDRLDLDTGKVLRRYIYTEDDKSGLGNREVWSLFKDHLGIIWAGGNNGMLHRYRPESDNFERLKLTAPHKQAPGRIVEIQEDLNGDLWLGSDDGLFYAKRDDSTTPNLPTEIPSPTGQRGLGLTVKYYGDAANGDTPFRLDRRAIRAISEDKQGNLWIGTEGAGVHFWDRKTNKYKIYQRADGLRHENIFGIMQDKRDNMWFSTGNGIANLHIKNREFFHYNQDHGLKGTNFNPSVYYKTRYGELAFGSDDGLVLIKPTKIYRNTYAGPTVINDFLVFNKSIPLDQPLSHLTSITLDHTQSMFSFSMAALNYDLPSQSQYAYKLEGFDDDWNHIGTQRNATYTNIDPGNYVFKVKSANNEGIWNSAPRVISLTILPPSSQTWWAWTLYYLTILALFGLVFYSFLQKNRAKDKEKLNRKLLDLDRVKDTFLANTSHELRTPLNGIIGLSQALIDGIGGQQSVIAMENLKLIVRSGKRLSYLINDILDYSKLKDTAITLHRSAVDLHSVVENIIRLNQPSIEEKPLALNNEIDKSMPPLMADENRLLQILHNIIGNAIKFTQEGHITVSTETTDSSVWICISDTGTGIASENINRVFEAFQQEDGSHTRMTGGTGLGLAVTKQLVELHGGEINISSNTAQGTTVRFSLSKPNQVLEPSLDQEENGLATQTESELKAGIPASVTNLENTFHETDYHILIVDDEPVNRRVLMNLLPMASYRVTPCSSGFQALELFENPKHDFDLILLDVMMPGISGYETCQKLRLRYSVSELPILFLTAKSRLSDLENAYNAGGNDYLTKPFAKEELLARIATQLQLLARNRSIEKEVILRTKEVTQSKQEVTQAYEKLKQTQGQLVQSEKMSSLGILVAGVGHEINNPVNFINNSARLIDKNLSEFKSLLHELFGKDNNDIMPLFNERFNILFEHLRILDDGSDRVIQIVDNLRTFSQSTDNCEALPLGHLGLGLNSTLALVKTNYKSNITFHCDVQDDPQLPCNSSGINQVFMNLMVNACQAMAGREHANLVITMKQVDADLCITFKDNGCGMPQSTIDKIFDPFFTTKPEGEGTGLGMAISYGIVERHKGKIKIISDVGVGTEISIYLPV